MMRLFYSDLFLEDIKGILDYYSSKNPAAAVRLGEGILATCKLLETNPELGVACEDLTKGLRMFSHRGFGLYYRIDHANHVVTLERVLHHSLDTNQQSFETREE